MTPSLRRPRGVIRRLVLGATVASAILAAIEALARLRGGASPSPETLATHCSPTAPTTPGTTPT